MWNSLNNNIRNVDTLSKFKSELKKIDETENHSVPKHFFCGPRKLNIILTLTYVVWWGESMYKDN
jgi:hypothetical protein